MQNRRAPRIRLFKLIIAAVTLIAAALIFYLLVFSKDMP